MSLIFTKNAFFSFPEPWYRFCRWDFFYNNNNEEKAN